MLFRIKHGLVDMNTDVIQRYRTRGLQCLRQLQASKDVYKYSFYPRTIYHWYRLPTSVTDIQTLQGFKKGIASLVSSLLHAY